MSRLGTACARLAEALLEDWRYLGLERILDTIEGHIRLLIILLILSVLVSVVLFVVTLAVRA